MSLNLSLIVARKELLTSVRDRQTAIYTFVLPLVMYPGLFWLLIQGFLIVQGQREQTEVTVGIAAAQPVAMHEEVASTLNPELGKATATPSPASIVQLEHRKGEVSEQSARSWMTDVEDDSLNAVLYLEDPEGDEPKAKLFYNGSKSRSELARKRIESRLPHLVDRLRGAAASAGGVDPRELDPVDVINEGVAPRRDAGALVLSMLLPIMLVIMTVMGAFFPAVDLVAGEKERRTAETTLLLPIPRRSMLQGKILAVCATAVVATILNLFAIGFSAEQLVSTLTGSGNTRLTVELPTLALCAITPLAVLFAFFVSATLTGVAGLAATFKEGQAMLGPVQMIFILPAMIGVVPGLQLTPAWACVPVVNVVLAFKAILRGSPLYLEYGLCSASLLLYAVLAIRAAVWLLSREEVQLAGATIPFKRILRVVRGDGRTT